ncbi:hypothetical protein C8R43DRAFT_954771 [Mycena crocata]|nr:hypothetical protein C8R43DRAFT_954771 [Mycena crocata]
MAQVNHSSSRRHPAHGNNDELQSQPQMMGIHHWESCDIQVRKKAGERCLTKLSDMTMALRNPTSQYCTLVKKCTTSISDMTEIPDPNLTGRYIDRDDLAHSCRLPIRSIVLASSIWIGQTEGFWDNCLPSFKTLIYKTMPAFHQHLLAFGRQMVTEYSIKPTVEEFSALETGQYTDTEYYNSCATKVKEQFLLDSGARRHFQHPVLKRACGLVYFGIGMKREIHSYPPLALQFPGKFKNGFTNHHIAAVGVLLHHALEEFENGEWHNINFTHHKFNEIYEGILELMQVQKHPDRTKEVWQQWVMKFQSRMPAVDPCVAQLSLPD